MKEQSLVGSERETVVSKVVFVNPLLIRGSKGFLQDLLGPGRSMSYVFYPRRP